MHDCYMLVSHISVVVSLGFVCLFVSANAPLEFMYGMILSAYRGRLLAYVGF
jgi:hypothetical protein